MKILGIDPFDRSRQGGVLLNELKKVGFRASELEYASDIPESGEGWYLLFGSQALRDYCGDVRMSDVSGTLMHCAWNEDALIVPNYAPGYIYHNPNMKPLWQDNLYGAWYFWTLDTKGKI